MNPHRLCWGAAVDFPVAQLVGAATIAGYFFTKEKSELPFERETKLLILLWILFTITTFFALNPELAWDQWKKVSKILLMTFFMLVLINDGKKLKYLLLVTSLSIGFFGLKGAVFGLITAGQYRVYGPPGSFIADNNDLGLALNMVLPMFLFMAREEDNKKLKFLLWVVFIMSIVSILLTYSRGGFLALGAVIFILLLKSNKKILAALLAAFSLIAAIYLLPAKWQERMHSIKEYEQDESAMGRINAWHFAWNLAQARPLTGGGFQTFRPHLFLRYAPNPENYHDAHSSYFEVLGEHGFIALGLFLALLASCFLSLKRLQRESACLKEKVWLNNYAHMLEVSLAAYMVGGAFLGRAYFDLFFEIVAIIIMLKAMLKKKLASCLCHEPVLKG